MSNIIPFEFESNKIRTISDKDGSIWFVAKDIAEALGYKDTSDAVKEHCKGAVKRRPLNTAGGTQKVRVILESDVYRLIVKSKLPSAEKFERWVFEEVLPTLRKTGSYSIKVQKLPSATTLMKLQKHFEELAQRAGLKENQLLLATNRGVAKLTGFNQLEAMDIKHLPSPDNDEYLTPTKIGERLHTPINPIDVNILLTYFGLQLRKADKKKGYIPTPKGESLGGRMMDVSKAHTGGSVQQLKWHSSIVPYLQKEINQRKQDNA